MDGFDSYNPSSAPISQRYAGTTANSGDSTGTGRYGSGLYYQLNSQHYFSVPLAGGPTNHTGLGIAAKVSASAFGNIGGRAGLVRLQDISNSDMVSISVIANGQIVAERGGPGSGTVLGTSTGPAIFQDTWFFLEVEAVRNASTGSVLVKVNGNTVLNITGANTGANDFNSWRVGMSVSGGWQIDDLYVTDGATLGECRIETLRPSADTAQKDWTASTGSDNYAMVDEPTFNGDTDYIKAATVGNKDEYDLGDLSFNPATIFAVQTVIAARKDDATTRGVRAYLNSSSSVANGAARDVGASYLQYADIFTTDPNTAAAWTQSGVNAAKIGIEVTT